MYDSLENFPKRHFEIRKHLGVFNQLTGPIFIKFKINRKYGANVLNHGLNIESV
jgi:hypothetical protein